MQLFSIKNEPHADELWAGIGGHFDSLGQIINEFLDNSISNFIGNKTRACNIVITLRELAENGNVQITIEDSGTGIKNMNAAFTLGSKDASESPMNEHGFGLKHALASANPENDSWHIYTRTENQFRNNEFYSIDAPYKIEGFSGTIHQNESWPGILNGSGTIIDFIVDHDMFATIAKGIKGNTNQFLFETIADILCEDIGFVYAGLIQNNSAGIDLTIHKFGQEPQNYRVGAVLPLWQEYGFPEPGTEKVDLGNGEIEIDYEFGRMGIKKDRIPFDNQKTSRKYYKQNMSSSGVEIRINGRVICYNLFKEIWGLEKHNSYNSLLIKLNLRSDSLDRLPKTRTSKNGLREGDTRLENLFEWIRKYVSSPKKDSSLASHETELFEHLAENFKSFAKPKITDTEKHVFTSLDNQKDLVRVDLYMVDRVGDTIIYEGKKDETTSKDVYQLRMYWDGLVFDGIAPTRGILIAQKHPDSVKKILEIVNTMKDAKGNNYQFSLETWDRYNIHPKVSKR